MQELLNSPQVKNICEQSGISYLGLFGSHARGDASADSDVDLLVHYERPVGLLTHAQIQNKFEDLLGTPVDLVFRDSIKPRIKPYIMQNLKTIYEKR